MSSSTLSAATGLFLTVMKSAKSSVKSTLGSVLRPVRLAWGSVRRSSRLSNTTVQAASRVTAACVVVAALWMLWPKEVGPIAAQGQALHAPVSLSVAGSLGSAVAQDTSQVTDVSAVQSVGAAALSSAQRVVEAVAPAQVDVTTDRSPAKVLDSERGDSSFPARSPGDVLSTPTGTPTPEVTSIPILALVNMEAFDTEDFRGYATSTPTATPTPTNMPILRPTVEPVVVPAVKGRIWPDFVPAPAEVADHYWLENPFAPGMGGRFASALYPYGTTAGGKYLLHHGVDMGGYLGTSLLAGAPGEIVHAGPDSEFVLGPYPNFFGNAVVIRLDQRLATPNGEQDVFALYGHLNQVAVEVGQRVETGDLVGYVGMTGIALGPHLHLEVRVGHNDYSSSINPWLWLKPFPGLGTLAVRVLAADGSTWQAARLSLYQLTQEGSKWVRTVTTYLDAENIGPDPAWGENGAMGDLSAGTYVVAGKINGEAVEAQFVINPGQTTFVELRTTQQ